MRKLLLILLIMSTILSCKQNIPNIGNKTIYSNLTNLDSLALFTSKLPISADTIFMGIRMGMGKKIFKYHIQNLKSDRIDIKESKDINKKFLQRLGGVFLRYEENRAYSIIMGVSKIGREKKEIFGTAAFVLFPIYNEVEGLVALGIVAEYKWDASRYSDDNWLWKQAQKTADYKPISLHFDIFLDEYGFNRHYVFKDNVLIERIGSNTLAYVTRKEMFRRIYLQGLDDEIKDKSRNKISF